MVNKTSTTSENIGSENLNKLREIFPQFVKDGEIDFDSLQAFFKKEGVLAGDEKYGLSWAGKSKAFQAIRTPSTGTLIPEKDESKNWDETENIFIEGDNLEVLKLLQKGYREKVKMIYIDPPYNTGKDFVYKDNFTQGVADYYEQTGQTKGGIKMTTNTEKNGRYHSDWLTMMYPRLFLARNLLKDDGVIFVSIDDNEVANLRLVMDEIFGEENFVGQLIIQTATDNNPTQINTEHEYMMCFLKNKNKLDKWTSINYAAIKIQDKYVELKGLYNEDIIKIQQDLRKWIRKNKKDLPKVSHYDNVDEKGVFHDGDIANTKFGGYSYEIIHPVTKEVCKIPEKGFRFPRETMMDMIKENNILFGKDETILIKPKIRLENSEDMLRTMIYEDGRGSSNIVNDLVGRSVFNNPKSHFLINRLIGFVCIDDDIILDFFAGSGTTAHAVMDLNSEGGGNRKWICVQLPEEVDEKSEAYKAGYKTISEISRERIRRAGDKINKGDIGFKSYRLSSSNYRKWNEVDNEDELKNQSKLFIESLLIENFNSEDVVYEIALKEGFNLNVKLKQDKGDLKAYILEDSNRKLFVTFSDKVTKEKVEQLKPSSDDLLVCFDNAMTDTDRVNVGRIINLKVI